MSASSKLALVAVGLGLAVNAQAIPGYTPWVSEENGGPMTFCYSGDEAVKGFQCSGGYCDWVRLWCETLPYDIEVHYYNSSDFFSEEDSGIGRSTSEGWYGYDNSFSHVCNYVGAAGIMTGISCQGSYCDNISVECATPFTTFGGVLEPVEMTDCDWTTPISEEDPPLLLADNQYITGVSCTGAFCDNKSFYACTLLPAANSCEGQCGSSARGGCWCDSACTAYGDCCDDYAPVCEP